MSTREYCIVVNPAARGGRAEKLWPALEDALREADVPHRVLTTEHSGHGRELAREALRDGCRHFLAVGGDGTVSQVLNGLVSGGPGDECFDVSLGVVPWGTGNDWARQYGLPASPGEVVSMLEHPAYVTQDLGRVAYGDSSGDERIHYFLNCAGSGLDSYLLQRLDSGRGGRWRYLRDLLRCLVGFSAPELRLQFASESLAERSLMLEVCLGRFAGGGMQFAPAAVMDDGAFDVLLIADLGRLHLLASLPFLYNGRINEHPRVRHWRCPALSVACPENPAFHCDGEVVGELPLRVEILPRALRVIVPPAPA
jgi:YegS/Rv2252/BmrU family lipid kinase